MMTLEEQEARAYADGDVGRARLLSLACEADDDVRADCQLFQEQARTAEKELADAEDEIEELRDLVKVLEAELEKK